jgi:hypothetical protein
VDKLIQTARENFQTNLNIDQVEKSLNMEILNSRMGSQNDKVDEIRKRMLESES